MTTHTEHQPTKQSPSANILQQYLAPTERQIPVQGPRILVVEDHAESGLLMQYALRKSYRTKVVATAEAALQAAAGTTYDGFLMDINLRSQRNGIDVLEALRADARYCRAPIIAVTAHALPGDRERFLQAGFDDYLSKPFTTDELRGVLGRQMSSRTVPRTPSLTNVPVEP